MDSRPAALDADSGPHCPACGFRVFNRRYPKCESCGAELPSTVVYTATERHSLIEGEEEMAREVARKQKPSLEPIPFGSTGTFEDSLLGALVESTGR